MRRHIPSLLLFLFILSCQQPDYSTYPNSFSLPFPEKYHLFQTRNDCGPYSVTAVINIFSDKKVSVEKMKKEITWRLENNYTLPFGLESLLKKYTIKIKTHLLNGKEKQKKIDFLKYQLSRGRPVILLGKITGTSILHYLTLLGYNEKVFYSYDSFQKKEKGTKYTIDDNGRLTGNHTFTHDEILEFWDGGGFKIFYKNYCIVAYGK